MKADLYDRITKQILEKLEEESCPGSSRGAPHTPPVASPDRSAPTASPTRASTF